MNNIENPKWDLKKMRKGRGIWVALRDNLDENGKQRFQPAIIIKVYPNHHLLVQIMTTISNKSDYFSIKINNKIQYVRPIYERTVDETEIINVWKDVNGKVIKLDKKSRFFRKVAMMKYQEALKDD